jgi:uncharacterized protein YbaR (Trm112 family)
LIDAELLEILVCPLTRSRLHQEGDYLVSEVGGLKYPIHDGIPVLLISDAIVPPELGSMEAFREKYRDQIPD